MSELTDQREVKSGWKRAVRRLATLVAMANAVLVIVQATLAQPPFDVLLPGWAYLVVNGAVVLGAGLTRILALLAGGVGTATAIEALDESDASNESNA